MGRFSDILGTLGTSFAIGPKGARAVLDAAALSAARTHALPDKSGTLALTSDIGAASAHLAGPGLVLNVPTNIIRLAVAGDVQIAGTSMTIPDTGTGSVQLQATGGQPPFTWTSVPLPAGISLAADGTLSYDGTQTDGSTNVLFTVTDALGNAATAVITMRVLTDTIATFCFGSGERGAWYDPSDLASMFQDTAGTVAVTGAGQSVALLKDKSGNGQDLSQATSTARPKLQQDGNGNYYLEFLGAQFLATPQTNAMNLGTDSYMAVAGAKFTSGSGNQAIFAHSVMANGSDRYGLVRDGSNLASLYVGTSLSEPLIADSSTALRVLSNVLDRTGGSNRLRINEADAASASFTSDKNNNLTVQYRFLLGAYNDASDSGQTLYLSGAIYGLVVRIADIDTDALNFTETYMNGQIT